jgi:hypothetical protein
MKHNYYVIGANYGDEGKGLHVAKKRINPRLYVSCRAQYKNPLNYIHLKDANFSWLPDSF